MKTGKELKPGTVLRIDNDPWLVQKAEFTKSGRNSAIMKTKLKNLLTGYKTETVYGADDKLDDVILDRKEATLSFINGDEYTFMDTTDYTMYELNAEDIEAVLPYIEEGMEDVCEAVFFEGRLVSVELPTTISRKVVYTENAARGDTSGKVMKLPSWRTVPRSRWPTSSRSTSGSTSTLATTASKAVPRSNASCETQKNPAQAGFFYACVFPTLSACLCSRFCGSGLASR